MVYTINHGALTWLVSYQRLFVVKKTLIRYQYFHYCLHDLCELHILALHLPFWTLGLINRSIVAYHA